MDRVRIALIGAGIISIVYGTFLLWHGPHRHWVAGKLQRFHFALFHRVSWLYPIGRGKWSEEQIHRAGAYVFAATLILFGS